MTAWKIITVLEILNNVVKYNQKKVTFWKNGFCFDTLADRRTNQTLLFGKLLC